MASHCLPDGHCRFAVDNIDACGGEAATVRTEAQGDDGARMAGEAEHLAAAGHVPQGRAVRAAGGEAAAIRTEQQREARARRAGPVAQLLAGRDLAQLELPLKAGYSEGFSVRTEHD